MDDEIDVQSTLSQAAGEGDAKTVSLLLSQKPELYERDEEGRTPLHLALEAGSPKVVKLLFEAGFDPQASTRRKFHRSERTISAFLIAAIAFLAKLVFSIVDIRLRHILRVEIFGELISWTLWTLMSGMFGMAFWNIYCIDYIVLQGPSLVSAATSFKGATESMITLLLDAGFEPDELEKETLWIHAAERGYRAVCERLLSKGIEVDQPFTDPESGWYVTALHCACRASRPILVSLLLEHGADPRLKDGLGRSALLFACESSPGRDDNTQTDTKAVVEMLLQAKAVETINDRAQRTEFAQSEHFPQSGLGWPLAEACCNGQPEVVLLLLIAGANPNIKDDSGITALHAAARAEIGQDSPMCDALLEHKAEVNAMTADEWSPLGYAIFYGSSGGSGEALIRAGADIGSGAGRFGTVLQLAARYEVASGDLLKLMLIKDDSSVNVIGGTYSTPLFAALNRPEGFTPQLAELSTSKISKNRRAD